MWATDSFRLQQIDDMGPCCLAGLQVLQMGNTSRRMIVASLKVLPCSAGSGEGGGFRGGAENQQPPDIQAGRCGNGVLGRVYCQGEGLGRAVYHPQRFQLHGV